MHYIVIFTIPKKKTTQFLKFYLPLSISKLMLYKYILQSCVDILDCTLTLRMKLGPKPADKLPMKHVALIISSHKVNFIYDLL